MFKTLTTIAAGLVALPLTTYALEDNEIPLDAPQDAIMASAAEVQEMVDWMSLAFAGEAPAGRGPAVRVELRRQDHSSLRFGQSCMETPLRLGQKQYDHGLGTHANSELLLHLPAGARAFRASIGIDNNFDSGGVRGSVQFSVEAGGKQLFHSPTLRGTNEPVAIEVPLPDGTRELTLKVDTTPDGPGHDQADWADARVVLADGREVWADEDRQPILGRALPFSFVYHGQPGTQLLAQWPRTVEVKDTQSRRVQNVTWTDPQTGLRVMASATAFKRYPAVEWLLHFENTGMQDSPLIENVQVLDASLRTGYYRKPVTLHHLTGDICAEQSFLPLETQLEVGKPVSLAPVGGRSSNGTFPFFQLQYGEEGLFTAIGWSGQWAARLERSAAGPTRLQTGMELTHLKLLPGERIRTPRVLVMPWQHDRLVAQARFRRLLLFEYVPRLNGRPLRLPVASQCFDRYVGSRPEWSTEAGQIHAAKVTRELGCDTHWFDAAWFEGGFPNGVGNWFCRPKAFPNGLKPVGDACHRDGLKFLLWFEPERVAEGTQIAREHPEFVLGGAKGGLFNLGDPAARRWLTDLLSQRITEFGLDVYRNDFNIDPLPFWRSADAPDRQGISEIRYVEGHYAMWDELRARHPGLWIDNCASGGRRIDLETIQRSVPLWRSDTGCAPGHADWDQSQVVGVGPYLPLFTSCSWEPDAYVLRSAASGGAICQFDFLNPSFSIPKAREALAEVKACQKYWYGDFYPLTRAGTAPDGLVAWQLHRPDLGSGIVLAFRRSDCPYPIIQTGLRGLSAGTRYTVEQIDESRAVHKSVVTGEVLSKDFELRMPVKRSSLLLRYTPKR
jgi:alpha-galactosidase